MSDVIQVFATNDNGRDFVCGDIHGHYNKLMTAMRSVGFDCGKDRLFCTGDLVDRGPENLKCLQLVYEPWFFSVRGNHEQLMIEGLEQKKPHAFELWLYNGGAWVADEDMPTLLQLANDALDYMPYAIELHTHDGKRIGICHAEVPDDDWQSFYDERFSAEHATWARSRIKNGDTEPVKNIDAVYVGHSIVSNPVGLGNVRYIDTGSFLPEGRVTIEEVA